MSVEKYCEVRESACRSAEEGGRWEKIMRCSSRGTERKVAGLGGMGGCNGDGDVTMTAHWGEQRRRGYSQGKR